MRVVIVHLRMNSWFCYLFCFYPLHDLKQRVEYADGFLQCLRAGPGYVRNAGHGNVCRDSGLYARLAVLQNQRFLRRGPGLTEGLQKNIRRRLAVLYLRPTGPKVK